MRIKKGDQIKILSGKDRGKTGKVLRSLPSKGKIVVEKLNLVKKHQRSKKQGQASERISIPMPLNVSNAQLICPKCGKPSRIGKKEVDGKNVRICKKCQAQI
jgi:large subunit ribosomal protein L24